MERHVRRSHPGIYEKYLEIKQKFFNPVTKNYPQFDDQLFNEVDLLNFNPGNFLKKKKFKTEDKGKRPNQSVSQNGFSKENIINACIELVTINGRSFSLMNDSGFKSLIEPMLNRIVPAITVNETSIKYSVLETAAELKLSIAEKVKNKVLCLKLDCLTYCTRSFLGVHIQYYMENVIKLLTLGTVEINVKKDTAELSYIVWDILNQFDISKTQIYCVVIDNGSSFSKLLEMEEGSSEILNKSSDFSDANTGGKPEFCFSANVPVFQKADSNLRNGEKNADDSRPAKSEKSEEDIQVITIYDEFDEVDNDLDSNTTDIIFGKLHSDFVEENKTIGNEFNLCGKASYLSYLHH